jgi:hypothetical protein
MRCRMNNYVYKIYACHIRLSFNYFFLLSRPLPPVSLVPHGVGYLLETGDVGTDDQGRNGGLGICLSSVPACLVCLISQVPHLKQGFRTYSMSA